MVDTLIPNHIHHQQQHHHIIIAISIINKNPWTYAPQQYFWSTENRFAPLNQRLQLIHQCSSSARRSHLVIQTFYVWACISQEVEWGIVGELMHVDPDCVCKFYFCTSTNSMLVSGPPGCQKQNVTMAIITHHIGNKQIGSWSPTAKFAWTQRVCLHSRWAMSKAVYK